MKKVYLLQHVHEHTDNNEDVKVIGIYKTEKKCSISDRAIEVSKWFFTVPNGFYIDEYVLDQDDCREGFITV